MALNLSLKICVATFGATIALTSCTANTVGIGNYASKTICSPEIQCTKGRVFSEDPYMARYPDLSGNETQLIHFCAEEPVDTTQYPTGQVVGFTNGCAKTFDGVASRGKPTGRWEYYWPNGRIRERKIFTADKVIIELMDERGNAIAVDSELLADDDALDTTEESRNISIRQSALAHEIEVSTLRTCSSIPKADLRSEPVIRIIKQHNLTLLYNGSTTRSLVIISSSKYSDIKDFRTVYHFSMRLGRCTTDGRSTQCPARISAFRKTAPLAGGVLKLSEALFSSDELTAKLMQAADQTIRDAYVECT